MPRKSPRARKKDATPPRVPGKGRPRATPGATRGRLATKRREQEPRHALKGARTTAKTNGRPRAAKPALRPRAAKPKVRPGAAKTRRRPRFTTPDPARIAAILGILERTYPDATTALDFETPLQLLIATILSAQCTDARVNMVTPVLFERWSDARALAQAPIPELEDVIRSTGFYRNKAKSIHSCTTDIVEKHGGDSAEHARTADGAAWRRAEDRERRARECVRYPGRGRGHTRRPPVTAARTHA
jgi:hypothetical protein